MSDVMKNINKLLDKNGFFLYQKSHYLVELIKTCPIQHYYHEHEYYSLTSLCIYFKKYNLKIFYAKNASA